MRIGVRTRRIFRRVISGKAGERSEVMNDEGSERTTTTKSENDERKRSDKRGVRT